MIYKNILIMKKITFWIFTLFSTWQIAAQVSSNIFSQSNGVYAPITGGLVLGTTTNCPIIPSSSCNAI